MLDNLPRTKRPWSPPYNMIFSAIADTQATPIFSHMDSITQSYISMISLGLHVIDLAAETQRLPAICYSFFFRLIEGHSTQYDFTILRNLAVRRMLFS